MYLAGFVLNFPGYGSHGAVKKFIGYFCMQPLPLPSSGDSCPGASPARGQLYQKQFKFTKQDFTDFYFTCHK